MNKPPPPPIQVFSLLLRAPGGQAGIHALRAMLKRALRSYDLRCLDARIIPTHAVDQKGSRK
jgi:hypothetical protein